MLVAQPRRAGDQLEIPTPSRFIRALRATAEAEPSRCTARVRAGRRRHPGRDSRGEDPVRPDGQKTTRGGELSLTASPGDRPPAQLSGVFEPDQGRGQSGPSAHRPGGPGPSSRSRPSSTRSSGAGCPMLESGTTGVLA